VGVYGLVGGIVKLDDAGLYLSRKPGALPRMLGRGLLGGAPILMKFLSIAGTAAMFMVGGGILTHGIPFLHHMSEGIVHAVEGVPGIGGVLKVLGPTLFDAVAGIIAGALVLAVVTVATRLFRGMKSKPKAG
jgi:hypothetical protein